MSERGGPVHSYTVRAHHHDGSGGSERAAPNRNTPLAWRVQGVAPNEGNGQGKDRGSGSGALNHARARAGTGSARTAQKNQTRCMPDLHEWVEHGQSHGGPSVTWDSPLTQGSSVPTPTHPHTHTHTHRINKLHTRALPRASRRHKNAPPSQAAASLQNGHFHSPSGMASSGGEMQ